MPAVMQGWQELWRSLHPGWLIKTWREAQGLPCHMLICDDEIIECRCPDYLSSCPSYAKRSDVWRYEILEQQGGVYLDTDIEPVKSIEPLLDGSSGPPPDAFAGLCETYYHWEDDNPNQASIEVGCSIMGCSAHHPWIQELVRLTPKQDSQAQISLAFPFLTEITGRHPEVRLLPPETFYPLTWDRYAREDHLDLANAPLSEHTYAVHRWSSTWFAEGLRPQLAMP